MANEDWMYFTPPTAAFKVGKDALGGLFGGGGSSGPSFDVNGELSRIRGLFAALRAQQEKNINTAAGEGRSMAASNLAARGTYTAPVSEHVFGQIEKNRLNDIATSNAQLGGQEAQTTSALLQSLMGYDQANQMRQQQIKAQRMGQFVGLGSNLLLAALMRNPGAAAGATYGAMPGGGYGLRYAGSIGSGDTANFGPSANF